MLATRGWAFSAACKMSALRFGMGWALLSAMGACSEQDEIHPPPAPVPDSVAIADSGPAATEFVPPPPPPACEHEAALDHECGAFELNFRNSYSWPAEAYQLRLTIDDERTYSCSITPNSRGGDQCDPYYVRYSIAGGVVRIAGVSVHRARRHVHLELGTALAPRWIEVDQHLQWVQATPCERCIDGGFVTPRSLEVVVPEPPVAPAGSDAGTADAGDAGAEPSDASTQAQPDAASDASIP